MMYLNDSVSVFKELLTPLSLTTSRYYEYIHQHSTVCIIQVYNEDQGVYNEDHVSPVYTTLTSM